MTQPGEIDGVTKQMNQSFNPVIHRRIQETMRNPTVEMVGFALPRSFEVILQTQPSKNVTEQYKERTCKCKSAGGAT